MITEKEIRDFAQLKPGWRHGIGHTPTQETIQRALEMWRCIGECGFSDADAFPGVKGEIFVTLCRGSECFVFDLEPDGTITFVCEKPGQETKQYSGLSIQQARERFVREAECTAII